MWSFPSQGPTLESVQDSGQSPGGWWELILYGGKEMHVRCFPLLFEDLEKAMVTSRWPPFSHRMTTFDNTRKAQDKYNLNTD